MSRQGGNKIMDTEDNMKKEGEKATAPVTPVTDTTTGKEKVFAVLAYLGPLIIISYLVKREDPFVKFHIKQGLILLCAEIILSLFADIVWTLWWLYQFLHFAILVLTVIGIINALQSKMKELPLVGGLSKYFDKI